ncbi:MAG: type IV toxin-antitoxin system AbiEi family antitoxin domain-containing protein [Limisphaerales bacterium]
MAGSIIQLGRRLASNHAVLRTRDFERLGVPRHELGALVDQGDWKRVGHGLYRSTRRPPDPNHSLLEVASRMPKGVICLLSALRFHDLTSERSTEVWVALPRNAWSPVNDTVQTRVLHVSEPAFSEGIEEHRVGGIPVRVYSVAKTIADCFKFRNQIGTAVAVEALRDAWRSRKVTTEDLWRCAKACRITNVIRPYLEALIR